MKAHFRTLRRATCRVAGHRYSAVHTRWYEERYGFVVYPEFALIACMDCGDLLEPLFVARGANVYHPDYPTWLPERLRHDQPCPLCQLLTYDPCWARCSACGVTEEGLFRAGLAVG